MSSNNINLDISSANEKVSLQCPSGVPMFTNFTIETKNSCPLPSLVYDLSSAFNDFTTTYYKSKNANESSNTVFTFFNTDSKTFLKDNVGYCNSISSSSPLGTALQNTQSVCDNNSSECCSITAQIAYTCEDISQQSDSSQAQSGHRFL